MSYTIEEYHFLTFALKVSLKSHQDVTNLAIDGCGLSFNRSTCVCMLNSSHQTSDEISHFQFLHGPYSKPEGTKRLRSRNAVNSIPLSQYKIVSSAIAAICFIYSTYSADKSELLTEQLLQIACSCAKHLICGQVADSQESSRLCCCVKRICTMFNLTLF